MGKGCHVHPTLFAAPGSGHTISMTVTGVNNTKFNNYFVKNNDNVVITVTI